jgi:hypothetical protein
MRFFSRIAVHHTSSIHRVAESNVSSTIIRATPRYDRHVEEDACCQACKVAAQADLDQPPRAMVTMPAAARRIRVVVVGTELAAELTHGGRVRVGRTTHETDLTIRDGALSRRQCEFEWTDQGVFVRDLRSACGTIVNGLRIQRRVRIDDNNRVYVGNSELRIVVDG